MMKRWLALLALLPGLVFGGVGGVMLDGVVAIDPNTHAFDNINLVNTGCVNIYDSAATPNKVGVLCLDGSDDLNIGDATHVDNMNFDIATGGSFDLQINSASILAISSTLADFSGIDVSVDNNKFYQARQSTGNAARNLLGFLGDRVQLGNAENELNIFSTGTTIFKGINVVDNIITIEGLSARSKFRMTRSNMTSPVTSLLPADTYAEFTEISASSGGLTIQGVSDNNGVGGVRFVVASGGTSPTVAIFEIRASKYDGATGVTDLAGTEIAYRLKNNATDLLTIFGSGAQEIVSTSTSLDAFKITVGTNDVGFFDFIGSPGADTTSAVSTFVNSGSTTHHIQISIDGTKAWIAASTTNPS